MKNSQTNSYSWRKSHFDPQEDEPLGPLANFVDIMLVFACGLIAALAALSPDLIENLATPQVIEKGKELPDVPQGIQGEGTGYEPMGQVFRDPETGKLYLIKEEDK